MRWWTFPVLGVRALASALGRWSPGASAPWPHGLMPIIVAAGALGVGVWRGLPEPDAVLGLPTLAFAAACGLVLRRAHDDAVGAWVPVVLGAFALALGWGGLDIAAHGADPGLAPLVLGRAAVALASAVVAAHLRRPTDLLHVAAVAITAWFTLLGWRIAEAAGSIALAVVLGLVGFGLPDWWDILSDLLFDGVFWLAALGVAWVFAEAATEEAGAGEPVDLRLLLRGLLKQTLHRAR